MATPVDGLAAWLTQAQICEAKLTAPQRGVLQAAFDEQKRLLCDDQSELFKERRRHDRVGDARFIFQADEHKTLGCSGPLPANHVSGHTHKLPVARFGKIGRAPDITQLGTNQFHGMRPRR